MSKTNRKTAAKTAQKTAAKSIAAAVATVVTPEPNKNRYNNGHRYTYPVGTDVLALVPASPAKGADQRKRWEELTAAKSSLKKGGKFTADYIAATCPGARRTMRRAIRMGAFVGWDAAKFTK